VKKNGDTEARKRTNSDDDYNKDKGKIILAPHPLAAGIKKYHEKLPLHFANVVRKSPETIQSILDRSTTRKPNDLCFWGERQCSVVVDIIQGFHFQILKDWVSTAKGCGGAPIPCHLERWSRRRFRQHQRIARREV